MFYAEEFLKQLDYQKEKQVYIRITSLDLNDQPREEITGRATGGSVNVDGASAVRRSCQLSLLTLESDAAITDIYWCYNNKFKLEIGIKNFVDKNYPDIIWFKMGVYIITSFSKSKTTNALNISISGKDKMCRLNGEVSGHLAMSTDFGTEETVEEVQEVDPTTGATNTTYQTTIKKIPLYLIIHNVLKEYGQERIENIIINDLDKYGYELWDYRGDTPMYFFVYIETGTNNIEIRNMTVDENTKVSWKGSDTSFKDLEKNGFQFYSMNTLDKDYNDNASQVTLNGVTYRIAQIKYGETAGYHRTELVYNSDLVLKAGETVTSLLDKIKAMLGDFEYFYDLDGRFVFQKKNTYIQELFSPINGEIVTPIMYASQYSYRFEDEELFTNISINPKIDNLKNDFSIWGSRKSATGQDLPVHVRYALHEKPIKYIIPYDRYNKIPDLYYIKAVPVDLTPKEGSGQSKEDIYKSYEKTIYYFGSLSTGINGYIQSTNYEENVSYYTLEKTIKKTEGFSENIYKHSFDFVKKVECYQPYYLPSPNETIYIKNNETYTIASSNSSLPYYVLEEGYFDKDGQEKTGSYIRTVYLSSLSNENINDPKIKVKVVDWRELIYQMAIDYYKHNRENDYLIKLEKANTKFKNGKTGYEQYYSDMQAFWRQLYSLEPTMWEIDQYGEYYGTGGSDPYWNKKLHTDPGQFNFWIDFLDTKGDFSKYNINKIGPRSKVTNETSVKSIYFRDTPEVLFIVMPKESIEDLGDMSYTPIWIQDNMEGLFYRSTQGLSAISKANELIYQHVAITESISLTSIPIYYLQPNTRIYIKGYGDYTLDRITYSLNYNGTMNITGNKIMKQFY